MDTLNLRFRVVNAGIAIHETPFEHEGEQATLKRRVLHVDAVPLDGTVRTLELELPASFEGKIEVDSVLHCTIEVEPAPEVAVLVAPVTSDAE